MMEVSRQLPNRAIVFAFLLIAAAAFSIIAIPHLVRAIESLRWPKCQGVIVSASLKAKNEKPFLVLTYSYTVNGRNFQSEEYDAFGPYGGSDPSGMLVHYLPGTKVMVTYCPKYPEQAVLQPGFNWKYGFVVLALGICWLFCGLSGWQILKDSIRQSTI